MKKYFLSITILTAIGSQVLYAQTNAAMSAATQSVAIAEYREGLSLYKQGKATAALEKAQAHLAHGGTAEGHYLAALCYKKLAKNEEAKESFENVVVLNANHAEALTQLGIMAYNSNDFNSAAGFLKKASALKPADIQIKEFYDKAKAKTIASQNSVHLNVEKRTVVAASYAPTNVMNKVANAATASFARPMSTDKSNAMNATSGTSKVHTNLFNQGLEALKGSDYYSAISIFTKASKEAPTHAATQYHLAIAYNEIKGEASNALKAAQNAVRLDGKVAKYHQILGNIFYDMGEGDKAQGAYESAYGLGMRNEGFLKSLASTYFFNSQFEKAIAVYERATADNPSDHQLLYSLGTAYLNGKKLNRAVETFKKVLTLNPGHKEAHYNMALAYVNLQKYTEAMALGKSLIKIDPDYSKGYLVCAQVYNKLGDSYNQDKYAKKAKALDPKMKF